MRVCNGGSPHSLLLIFCEIYEFSHQLRGDESYPLAALGFNTTNLTDMKDSLSQATFSKLVSAGMNHRRGRRDDMR